ncbi:uncharacterized protein LOC135116074 [Scylla paramamosain]|uniref:uncharacterized protein LOC135116074 n=1 Tax=Scylla paramamosain TaxID=85552 RepID=UPI0030839753
MFPWGAGLVGAWLPTFLMVLFTTLLVLTVFGGRPKNFPPGLMILPVVGSLLSMPLGPSVEMLRGLRKKYGDISSFAIFGTRMVVVSGVSLMKEVFALRSTTDRPDVFFTTVRNRIVTEGRSPGIGIIGSSGQVWQEQRRFMLHHLRDLGFGKSSYEPVMIEEIAELMDLITKEEGSPLEMRRLFNRSVINILWAMVMGQRYHYGDAKLEKLMVNLGQPADFNALTPAYHIPHLFKFMEYLPRHSSGYKFIRTLSDFLKKEIKDFMADEELRNGDNFTALFLKEIEKKENPNFNMDQLAGLVFDLFVAGMETTSSTLTAAVNLISKHPEVQRRMQEELDEVVGRDRLPTFSDVERLPYVQATINEVQRVLNLIKYSLPHQTNEDCKLCGYDIPKGTWLLTNLDDALRNSEYWKNATEFDPQNFLDEYGKYKKNNAFMPFGVGKRVCAGEPLARLELFLFITHLYQRFTFTLVEEHKSIVETNPMFNSPPEYSAIAKCRPIIQTSTGYNTWLDSDGVRTLHLLHNMQCLKMPSVKVKRCKKGGKRGTMPFLDFLVKQQQVKFNTAVYSYIKPTNPGYCLNGRSECPDRYKDSSIAAYIRRALTHCSTWQQLHEEIEGATQVSINNGFSEKNIVHQTKIIDKWHNSSSSEDSRKPKIYRPTKHEKEPSTAVTERAYQPTGTNQSAPPTATTRRSQSIHTEQMKSNIEQQKQAQKMIDNSVKRFQPAKVGETVMVPVPLVDRGRAEFPNVKAVVFQALDNGTYKLGTKHGLLKQVYTRNQFTPCLEKFLSLDDVVQERESYRSLINRVRRNYDTRLHRGITTRELGCAGGGGDSYHCSHRLVGGDQFISQLCTGYRPVCLSKLHFFFFFFFMMRGTVEPDGVDKQGYQSENGMSSVLAWNAGLVGAWLPTFLLVLFTTLLLLSVLGRRPKNFPPGMMILPVVGSLLSMPFGPSVEILRGLRKKYGDIASFGIFGTRVVLVSGVSVMKEVFALRNTTDRPEMIFTTVRNRILTDGRTTEVGIGAVSGQLWQEQRRFLLHHLRDLGFGKSSYEPVMVEEISELMECMSKEKGRPLEMRRLFNRSVINILWAMVMGRRYPYGHVKLNKLIHSFVQPADFNILSPVQHIPHILKIMEYIPTEKEGLTKLRNILTFVKEEIKEFMADEELRNGDNFTALYLKEIEKKANPNFNMDQLMGVIFDLFVAGMETTSSTLTTAVNLIAKHPHVQRRVQEELDEVVGRNRLPSFSDMERLPYVQATIHEVQRVLSLAKFAVPHMTSEDCKLGGYDIPKGTWLMANLDDALKNSEYWKNAREFDPQNFLDENGKYKRNNAFMPFGVGKRACAGEPLARLELFLFFTHLFQRFTFTLVEEQKPIIETNPTFNAAPEYTASVKCRPK